MDRPTEYTFPFVRAPRHVFLVSNMTCWVFDGPVGGIHVPIPRAPHLVLQRNVSLGFALQFTVPMPLVFVLLLMSTAAFVIVILLLQLWVCIPGAS